MYCSKCGQNNKEGAKYCIGCGKFLGDNKISSNNFNNEVKPQHGANNKKAPKKKGILILLLFVALAAVFILLPRNNGFKLGNTEQVIQVKISNTGGVIEITDENSSVKGMKIKVPGGAYDEQKEYIVKTTEIISHDYGDLFTPVTPLITINNGHEFSNKPIYVEIPVEITEGEFLMGFFYDKKTGKLEAIPFDNYSSSGITLITNHFSDIVVSKVNIEELRKVAIDTSVSIDTKFVPGKDDWQYPNYGSALAPGGHCAGQSLTMAWYYYECHLGKKQPRLYGRFDNNGGEKSMDFWQDDSLGYRFASVVQYSINWYSKEFQEYLVFSNESQERTFYAFAYAMKITGEPQFMGIYSYNSYGERTGGHAIIAYKVENGKIYVADPNYPAQQDRYVALENKKFKPYSSGANASSIDEYGAVLYTDINFLAKSALIDFALIEENYDKLLSGTVGDTEFPNTKLSVMSKYNDDFEKTLWSNENKVTLNNDYITSLPVDMKNKGLVCIAPQAKGLVYTLFMNESKTPEQDPTFEIFDGKIYFEIDLKEGSNTVAFLVEQEQGGNYYYVDFMTLQIEYVSKPVEKKEKTVKNDLLAKVPGEYHLTYIGGVGKPGSENTSIVSEIYYLNEDGTLTFRSVRKDTDSVTRSGEWSLKGNILTIDGIDYIFNGQTITMDSEYPWTYTKK